VKKIKTNSLPPLSSSLKGEKKKDIVFIYQFSVKYAGINE
jgi:hypothetical protein